MWQIYLIFTVCLIGACSDQRIYDFGQSLGESMADCEALTSFHERKKCVADFDKDYATYHRERKAL